MLAIIQKSEWRKDKILSQYLVQSVPEHVRLHRFSTSWGSENAFKETDCNAASTVAVEQGTENKCEDKIDYVQPAYALQAACTHRRSDL
jgi:hypothetical protein